MYNNVDNENSKAKNILKIVCIVFIVLYNVFYYEYAFAGGNFARGTRLSGGWYKITIKTENFQKSYTGQMKLEDISFSPTGRYLLVEKSVKNRQYFLEICDTSLFSDDLIFPVTEDASSMIEQIIKGRNNTFFKVAPEDRLSFDFEEWHDTEDYMKISYKTADNKGDEKLTGYVWIDYGKHKIISHNEPYINML